MLTCIRWAQKCRWRAGWRKSSRECTIRCRGVKRSIKRPPGSLFRLQISRPSWQSEFGGVPCRRENLSHPRLLRPDHAMISRCCVSLHCEMKQREIFFRHKTGARFSSKFRTQKFWFVSLRANSIRTTHLRSTPLWLHSRQRTRGWFHLGCCRECPTLLRRWWSNGGWESGRASCGVSSISPGIERRSRSSVPVTS